MSEPDFDVLVVGGGVVGLAVAAAAAERGRGVVLLERHDGFGREGSSRNSEVVHAGLYYPQGTLKARLCVEGRRELYRLADDPLAERDLAAEHPETVQAMHARILSFLEEVGAPPEAAEPFA